MKTTRNPSAYSIGESKRMLPRQRVASQLKIMIPNGTAMTIAASMDQACSDIGSPTEDIW